MGDNNDGEGGGFPQLNPNEEGAVNWEHGFWLLLHGACTHRALMHSGASKVSLSSPHHSDRGEGLVNSLLAVVRYSCSLNAADTPNSS